MVTDWRLTLTPVYMQVVQAIGAAEAELLNWGLPKRIDGDGAINLIKAAEDCGVTQYLQVLLQHQSSSDKHEASLKHVRSCLYEVVSLSTSTNGDKSIKAASDSRITQYLQVLRLIMLARLTLARPVQFSTRPLCRDLPTLYCS